MSAGVGQLVLSGPLILAVPVALAAGAITFISPCCLPLVPGYLSYVTGMSGAEAQRTGAAREAAGRPPPDVTASLVTIAQADTITSARAPASPAAASSASPPRQAPAAAWRPVGRGRTVAGTALFVLGFSALFASYGAAFGGLGEALLTHQHGLIQVLGGLTILLGLLFAGAFYRFPVTGRILRPS